MLLHAVSKLLLPTQKVVSLACFRSTAERKLTLGVAGCSIAPHIVSSILDADLSIKATARGHPFSCCVHATLLVLSGRGRECFCSSSSWADGAYYTSVSSLDTH